MATSKKKLYTIEKVILALVVGALIGAGIYYLFDEVLKSPQVQPQATATPLPENAGALVSVATWVPDAGWSVPAPATEDTSYGKLSGYKTTGTITSDQAYLDPYEHKKELESMGYTLDNMLDAGGPGSSMWGYKLMVDGKQQILVLGYSTTPTNDNPNEPLEFNCPCQMELSAFVSNLF